MEPDARLAKKRAEAYRLRSLAPEVTVEMGFSLMEFARELAEATRRTAREP